MTPKECKEFLDAGIFQAYAEGKEIEYLCSDDVWEIVTNYHFSYLPHRYRIKAEFQIGDLVREKDSLTISKVIDLEDCRIIIEALDCPGRNTGYDHKQLVHVKETRTPFTIRDAVKAINKHGFNLKRINPHNTLYIEKITRDGVHVKYTDNRSAFYIYQEGLKYLTFTNETPFCNITYEDI